MNWQTCLRELYGSDRFYQEVFDKEIYKPVKNRNADVVIDLGACGGEFSYWLYDKATQIYAIEPETNEFNEIKLFTDCHRMDKIKYFNLAIGDHNGKAYLNLGVRGGHTVTNENKKDGSLVKIKTLTRFIIDNNIEHVNILKIDIEDGEIGVFGSSDFKYISDRIDFIIGEHHSGNEALKANGFKITDYEYGWYAEKHD